MRLLIVSQYFWPENFRINDLVAELVRRGHAVTVLTGIPNYPDGDVFPEFRADPDHYSKYEGAEVIRAPLMSRGKGGFRLILNYLTFAVSASLIGLWRLRGRQFDVIFAYEPSPVTVGLPAVVMRAVKRTPLAFWVLDLWPETLQAIGVLRSSLLLRTVGKLVSFIYLRCDLILAQSRSFIPQIQKYAGVDSRIVYFPSWAESGFDMKMARLADEVPLKSGSFNVMFAGNIGDAQDFPAILDAAEMLRASNVRWLIVGGGRKFSWLQREVIRRGLHESVLLLGRTALERMPSFYKHAQALLVSLEAKPIFSLTIPGKLQSYLAAGIPVLAMLDGEGADLVARSGAGLVCSAGDSAGLASAVLRMSDLTDTDRIEMGQKGRLLNDTEFNRNNLITHIESLFDDLRNERLN